MEPINTGTGMTHAEGRQFIRSHCEDFVNKKNLRIGELRSGFCGSRSRCTARNASGGGRYYYNYALRGERLRLNVTGPVPVLQASRRSRFGKQRFFLFFSTFDLLTFEIS